MTKRQHSSFGLSDDWDSSNGNVPNYENLTKQELIDNLKNARINAHNDRLQSETKWGLKMDKKNAEIKELRSRLDNGVPDESKEQQRNERSRKKKKKPYLMKKEILIQDPPVRV